MSAPKLPLWDERMMQVLKFVKAHNLNQIYTQKDFLLAIGFDNVGNLTQVKKGLQSFRMEHISAACELFNVDANFFFIQTHPNMFKTGTAKTGIQFLREAVKLVSAELAK